MIAFLRDWTQKHICSSWKNYGVICLSVLVIGIALSLLCWPSAFQRCGALMVCFAIWCLYVSQHVALELQFSEALYEGRQVRREKAFKPSEALKGEFASEEYLNEFIDASRKDRARQNTLRFEKVKIEQVEYLSAFLGTFIWGFGDIPFS